MNETTKKMQFMEIKSPYAEAPPQYAMQYEAQYAQTIGQYPLQYTDPGPQHGEPSGQYPPQYMASQQYGAPQYVDAQQQRISQQVASDPIRDLRTKESVQPGAVIIHIVIFLLTVSQAMFQPMILYL